MEEIWSGSRHFGKEYSWLKTEESASYAIEDTYMRVYDNNVNWLILDIM